MHQLELENTARYMKLAPFFQDAASNNIDAFPSYCFIDLLYRAHARTRTTFGSMTRKLSMTELQISDQLFRNFFA